MRIFMELHWPGITAQQYDQIKSIVRWDVDPAKGGVFHAAAIDAEGLHAHDVWESADEMNAFIQQRLMPAVVKAGITSQPNVTVRSLHSMTVPALIR